MQTPEQIESQQTPSTQKLLWHSSTEEHVAPLAFLVTHFIIAVSQNAPLTHWLLFEHVVKHAVPEQM
jgi:hypothetical protein